MILIKNLKCLFLALVLILVSCIESEREIMMCSTCQSSGPYLRIRLNPPAKESVEIEIKTETNLIRQKCRFDSLVKTTEDVETKEPNKGTCNGQIQINPSPIPTSSFSNVSKTLQPEDIKAISVNELVFWGIKEKEVQVILRNLAGDVLAQQNFKLSTDIYPGCSNKYPNCTTTEVTLHLSKPTEPTPTPSSTPSP